jgi:hypothetical protein
LTFAHGLFTLSKTKNPKMKNPKISFMKVPWANYTEINIVIYGLIHSRKKSGYKIITKIIKNKTKKGREKSWKKSK